MTQPTDYGALALLPPLMAIVIAIWKRQVVISLLAGIWIGATIMHGYNPLMGLLDACTTYIVKKSLADVKNISIIVFCIAVGGMVGVMGKSGGSRAIAEAIVKKAKSTRTTQLAAALMGIAIFFDDYANSIIVGNTMRPVTDRQRISREKLAYIVDSTAAPVSSMAPVSTWIAMELGLIAAGFSSLNIKANSMVIFIQTLPFRFYSIFALSLVFNLILQGRDYGKMLSAEIRSRKTGQVYASGSDPLLSGSDDARESGATGSVWDAAIPISSFLFITVFGLWFDGYQPGRGFRDSIGNADASVVLIWASIISSLTAITLGLIKKRFTLNDGVESWMSGARSMMVAVVILALAFALKGVIGDMGLAPWIAASSEKFLSGYILPLIIFCIAMATAFATGSSWGTNSILMPIVIPIAASVAPPGDPSHHFIIASIAAVLTGAVFGDHCSPISDTTILSSMASGSDLIDHVRTQLPYALTAAAFSIVIGFIPAGLGLPPWVSLAAGIAGISLVVRIFGKKLNRQGDIV